MSNPRRARRALRQLLVLLAIAMLPVRAMPAQATSVKVTDAWVREMAAGRTVTAVFLELTNAGAAERRLVRGATTAADTLELHEMKRDGGMMRMSPVPQISIPAGETVSLRPGGLHLMLFGAKRPLAAGDMIREKPTLADRSTPEEPAA
ncbi:MAG TPA: copper chaperone PCu(A)C, partial [Gemmatimonadaceae bacterium]|nr:copper chaperone PCu(A)C [Gemmatimonadaceae bacterium]